MEGLIQITAVPLITAVVYGAMQIYKHIAALREKWIRLIPFFACILGTMLGIIAYFGVKTIMPADNLFTAMLIGGASGLAATGTNQIFKQLTKEKEDKNQ